MYTEKNMTVFYDCDGKVTEIPVVLNEKDTYEDLTRKIGQNSETVLVFCDGQPVPLDDVVSAGKITILKVTFDGH